MKVILLEDVKSVGKKGDLVEIKEGYAKNFIIPKKLGVEATDANRNTLKLQKQNEEKIAREQLEAAQALAAEIEQMTVRMEIKGGEGGKTFGSVYT
ncbi:MAG: 50S ribosomal protein L9, partial [Lachnospiraceae bacterium]|nr:50S ribosomal protein L9 [Lachnospiraceae bacterium]